MTDMGKSEYRKEQIIGFLRQVEAGVAFEDMFRTYAVSGASVYKWRAENGAMVGTAIARSVTTIAIATISSTTVKPRL